MNLTKIDAPKYDIEWAARHLAGQIISHAPKQVKYMIGSYASDTDDGACQVVAAVLLDSARTRGLNYTRDDCIAYYHEQNADTDLLGVAGG